jgi:hypothetical protein
MILVHKFVNSVPDTLESGVIYVSVEYATVIHKCCCGCGNEVVTPLSPTDWKLMFDGKSISLYPSIGNWSFKCQSHYWIKNNKVEWSPKWDKTEIAANRKDDTKTTKIHSKPKGRESFFGRLFKKKPTK